MADTTIEELTAATTLNDDDLLVVQQGNFAKKLSGKGLKDYFYSEIDFITPEMFGAKGDGIEDDTKAIQDAINHGGLIVCGGTYRITDKIHLRNPEDTADKGTFKKSRIVGKNGIINQLDSQTQISYLQRNQATFYHDGGKFVVKYTSNVEFSECVFMGSKDHEMTDYAFIAPEAPFRRLHIENCTFANFNCAIWGNREQGDNSWCGECIFDGLYFALCNYCIVMERLGGDCAFRNMIAQGSCGYFLRLTGASGALISGNHDYSRNGCVIYGCANITGNYFDGLNKLHIKGGSNGGVFGAKYGPLIVGNIFLLNVSRTGSYWIFAVDEMLYGAVICDNRLFGGDNASEIILFNVANVDTSASGQRIHTNIIRNNTGKITNYFTNELSSTMSQYGNDLDKYRLYAVIGNSGEKVYEDFFWGSKSATFFGKYLTPASFYLHGTSLEGIYCKPLSFVKVKLNDDSLGSATFNVDGSSLNTAINNEWGFSNIAELEVEIHINFGVITTTYPDVKSSSTIEVSIPIAPNFSDAE